MVFSGFYAHAASPIHDDSAISVQAIGNKIDKKGRQPLRSLFDSISRNDKNETDSLRVFLERESQNEQKGFNTTKEELRLARERNALRRQSDNGEKTAKPKRESAAKPVEKGSKQTAVERTLDQLGYKTSWSELNGYDRAMAFSSLAEKYESLKLGYTFVVLRGRIEADEARYSRGCTMRSDDLAKFLEINPAKLNEVGKKIVKLVEEFKTNNPGKEVVELKIEDFFHILDRGVIMQDSITIKASYHYFLWKYIFATSTHEDILKLKEGKSPEEIDALCTDMSFMFVLSCGPVHLPPVLLVSIDKNDILEGLKLAHVKVSKDIKVLVDFLFDE